jgi:hypothetical protein
MSGHTKAQARVVKAMGCAPWRTHDLRRTVASHLAQLSVAPHVIEAVLNHKSGTIRGVAAVYNRYDYLAEKRAALEAWGKRLREIIGGGGPGPFVTPGLPSSLLPGPRHRVPTSGLICS